MALSKPEFTERTIGDYNMLFNNGGLNLEPPFQRKSVWTLTDRRRLIESVSMNIPVPCIFLYTHFDKDKGKHISEVIDGKQRLETVFMFLGSGKFKKDVFDAELPVGESMSKLNWKTICKAHQQIQEQILSYKIQTVEIDGDLSDIITLFVRINSTGKRLTSSEKRNAQFYTNPLLKRAGRLVDQLFSRILQNKILTQQELRRMKGVEVFSELLLSIYLGGIINKKTALDKAMQNKDITEKNIKDVAQQFMKTFNTVFRMFPNLRETRFVNSVDFYTLFMVVWEMEQGKFILSDRKLNETVFKSLKEVSSGVDTLLAQLRKAEVTQNNDLRTKYLLTIRSDTDSSAQRERRAAIIKNLLLPLFQRKDDKRVFGDEVKRILWNATTEHRCPICGKPLTWKGLSVDHIVPYSKGGRTTLENAQLVHVTCNSSKGSRT